MKLKLGFIYRAVIGFKDNLIDNPKINKNIDSFSIGKTILGQNISGYSIYSKKLWDSELIPEQKTGHSMIWGLENNIEIIEIELKTRYSSEWKRNKKALINSVKK